MHGNEFLRATTLSALAAGLNAVTPSLAVSGPVALGDTYDFIVVGGGTAGLTVASRLSEDPSVSVLVLEAGLPDHYEKEVMVPWFSAVGFMRAPYGWGMYYDLFGQRVELNQGKVLGGDSIKHALVYDRPVPGDLAAFKQLGMEGWSHEQMLPYFNKTFDDAQRALYYANRTGRWTRGYATVFAFLPAANITSINGDALPFVTSVNDTEDGIFIPNTLPPTVAAGYHAQLAVIRALLTTGAMAALEVTFIGGGTFLMATDLHPLSRGTVALNGSDPWANPAVDPRYLTHQKDVRALAAGVRLMRRIAAQEVVVGTLGPVELDPGPQRVRDEELQAWMANLTTKGNHYCGTCAMLPRDLGGVVDADLRVYGVSGLRVVDASVLTVVPSARMQATVFAIGEKAADLIKKDWGLK